MSSAPVGVGLPHIIRAAILVDVAAARRCHVSLRHARFGPWAREAAPQLPDLPPVACHRTPHALATAFLGPFARMLLPRTSCRPLLFAAKPGLRCTSGRAKCRLRCPVIAPVLRLSETNRSGTTYVTWSQLLARPRRSSPRRPGLKRCSHSSKFAASADDVSVRSEDARKRWPRWSRARAPSQ